MVVHNLYKIMQNVSIKKYCLSHREKATSPALIENTYNHVRLGDFVDQVKVDIEDL